MRLLLLNDLHLGPSDDRPAYARPEINEAKFDAIVTAGDVVDENRDHAKSAAGERYERVGRAFYEFLHEEYDLPIVVVPGNHDPLDCVERLTEGLDRAIVAHERVLREADFPDADFEGFALAGWGCEQFDQRPEIRYTEFPGTDPLEDATAATIDHVAAERAVEIETLAGRYLDGDADAGAVADALGIADDDRARLADQLAALERRYEALYSLVTAEERVLFFTHVPPFDVAFDHHHSGSGLRGRIRRGSIALKHAVRRGSPHAVCSGHTHEYGIDTVATVRGDRYAFNAGSPGVAVVEVTTDPAVLNVRTT
ncbi:metallophosphoesterase [Halorussus sp. MSC15.2]|uniref:metallophosphoesterase family protein n=1 Tax=Halorussus sp. MSC15.2 TaxID=2283638 RepID=UPI0013D7A05F|nr:metallophosphoesterase [Halorussus sp. MSC15.2]NEU57749.1 metallophosphoesterase [Halorussus sp. MSC15.2]